MPVAYVGWETSELLQSRLTALFWAYRAGCSIGKYCCDSARSTSMLMTLDKMIHWRC